MNSFVNHGEQFNTKYLSQMLARPVYSIVWESIKHNRNEWLARDQFLA